MGASVDANVAPAASLDRSTIVSRTREGNLAVAMSNGTPINGVKLSRHDSDIHNPTIVAGADGTIHVAFVERMLQLPYDYSVYYRGSAYA